MDANANADQEQDVDADAVDAVGAPGIPIILGKQKLCGVAVFRMRIRRLFSFSFPDLHCFASLLLYPFRLSFVDVAVYLFIGID